MGKTVRRRPNARRKSSYFVDTLGYDRIDNPKLKALMKLQA
jgi:hypothetical protein